MKLSLPRFNTVINVAAGLVMILFDEVVGNIDERLGANGNMTADDLTRINGIGPAYARRLNEAGINSFSQLSELDPEQVRDLAQLGEWQGEPEEWIAQAKDLASLP